MTSTVMEGAMATATTMAAMVGATGVLMEGATAMAMATAMKSMTAT